MKTQMMAAMQALGDQKPQYGMFDTTDIKDWVTNELNQFTEKLEIIEDMKHEQEHLKLQCNFHSNNIDDIQFQIQNQLKILRETDGYKDT